MANPEVADLKVVTNSQLLVTAKGVGDTYLTLWDKSDRPLVMSLHVTRNLDALRHAGIEFEVIPGVTAALGAAASAQISLTDRRHASRVVFAVPESTVSTLPPAQDVPVVHQRAARVQTKRECLHAGCPDVDSDQGLHPAAAPSGASQQRTGRSSPAPTRAVQSARWQ